jgi:hypothetical protein
LRSQQLREVMHPGEPGLERGVSARVGAGAAGALSTGDRVLSESTTAGRSGAGTASMRDWARGCAAFVAGGRLLGQVLAESGEHGARAAQVMTADQVGGEQFNQLGGSSSASAMTSSSGKIPELANVMMTQLA